MQGPLESADLRPLDALHRVFGLDAFRPGQLEAVESAVCGRDTLVIMPTGAGKSLVYQVASLVRSGTTLVISPLIALMRDQTADLAERGIGAVAALHSQLGVIHHQL